jgi:hypothetical protein
MVSRSAAVPDLLGAIRQENNTSSVAEQKRKARNRRQNRWKQRRKHGVEVSSVPTTRLVRKYLVEVIKWQDRDELQNLGPRERRDAFGEAIAEGLEEAARAYYLKK